VDPYWLCRNIASSWVHAESVPDFFRCLAWTYSAKLPAKLKKREWAIGFRYPAPVGSVRLLLRANSGSDAFIQGEVFHHRYYEIPLASPPETILDLGANTGMTAVYFGRAYPAARLACVEPVPDNLRVLARNLELNAIRAEVIAGAVDAADGSVRIELGSMDYGHKVADPYAHASRPSIEAVAYSIPTILRRLGWQRIGLLKVDIEGHEKILFSADCDWLDHVDAMCIECHPGFGEADLVELAGKYGFGRPEQLPGIWFLVREPRAIRQ